MLCHAIIGHQLAAFLLLSLQCINGHCQCMKRHQLRRTDKVSPAQGRNPPPAQGRNPTPLGCGPLQTTLGYLDRLAPNRSLDAPFSSSPPHHTQASLPSRLLHHGVEVGFCFYSATVIASSIGSPGYAVTSPPFGSALPCFASSTIQSSRAGLAAPSYQDGPRRS